MKEYKLVQWYPSLPTEWFDSEFPIIVVERENDEYHLHPSLKGLTRFAIISEREVDRNEEFWKELVPKKTKAYTKKEVDLLLKEQHRNTRHDAIDVIRNHFLDLYGNKDYTNSLEIGEKEQEIYRDIQNLKQRKS